MPHLSHKQKKFRKNILRPLTFSWYMLNRLPSIVFWNVRVSHLDENVCQTVLPFTWRTQNPFGSIYFAALAAGAELASGALCMLHLTGKDDYSMLVTEFHARFYKKATGTVTFTCNEGKLLAETLKKLEKAGDTQILPLNVTGISGDGYAIGEFSITWSFKRKS